MTTDEVINYYHKLKDRLSADDIFDLFIPLRAEDIWPTFQYLAPFIDDTRHYTIMLISAYLKRSRRRWIADTRNYFLDERFIRNSGLNEKIKQMQPFMLFRGGSTNEKNSQHGLSWTLDRSVAEDFAFRFDQGHHDRCVYGCISYSADAFHFAHHDGVMEVVADVDVSSTIVIQTEKTAFNLAKSRVITFDEALDALINHSGDSDIIRRIEKFDTKTKEQILSTIAAARKTKVEVISRMEKEIQTGRCTADGNK